jgi:geranylgeranyl reductase family protein
MGSFGCTSDKVDVLIVGLGPAGGSAALAAAVRGLKVAAVERKQVIGVPVQCAEFIPLPMGKYARAKGVLQQRIRGMRSVLPSGEVRTTESPGLMVDRAAFDQALALEAEMSGARLCRSSRLVELDPGESIALVQTATRHIELEYKVLIAADGPHSFVARSLGLAGLELVETRQYTVPLISPFEDTEVWLSGRFPGGYAWLFPKGKVANLGVGLDKRLAHDLKQPLEELYAQLVAEGLVGPDILSRTGGAIPVGGMREQLVIDNILFVGDAAGLAHPITGAGIAAAVLSGERAGLAAASFLLDGDKDALEGFEREMRDQFEASLQRAVSRRKWLSQYWQHPEASLDAVHRKGWIAFPEYFTD